MYVFAPDAVIVELPPEQIMVGFAVAETTGNAFTNKLIVLLLLQPNAFDPVTV